MRCVSPAAPRRQARGAGALSLAYSPKRQRARVGPTRGETARRALTRKVRCVYETATGSTGSRTAADNQAPLLERRELAGGSAAERGAPLEGCFTPSPPQSLTYPLIPAAPPESGAWTRPHHGVPHSLTPSVPHVPLDTRRPA